MEEKSKDAIWLIFVVFAALTFSFCTAGGLMFSMAKILDSVKIIIR